MYLVFVFFILTINWYSDTLILRCSNEILWKLFIALLFFFFCNFRDDGEIVSGNESEEDDEEETKTSGLTDLIKEEFKKRKVSRIITKKIIISWPDL